MITKAQVKHIQLLSDKKYRQLHNQFVIEGDKMVEEALHSGIKILSIYAHQDWMNKHQKEIKSASIQILLNQNELTRMSQLSTPQNVLAICELPTYSQEPISGVNIILDGVQDPGNVGSIIRIADWFNIKRVFCSANCADAFNPKVLQATMGSIFRVEVVVQDLLELLNANKHMSSYVATLHGKSVNSVGKISEGFIIMGNESKGVREEIIACSKKQITIPKLGHAESLNVAVASGIICHALLS